MCASFVEPAISRETAIGAVATALAVAAMAVDHLPGDDPGLEDPPAFLGLPIPLAGGGVALGLLARDGERARLAVTAIAVGTLVLLLASLGYAVQAAQKL